LRSGVPPGPRGARYSCAVSGTTPMTTIATVDTFVSLRRIFFIEVILFPAAIFWLVTVAHASEQKKESSAG
jgi:hypothetical protein